MRKNPRDVFPHPRLRVNTMTGYVFNSQGVVNL